MLRRAKLTAWILGGLALLAGIGVLVVAADEANSAARLENKLSELRAAKALLSLKELAVTPPLPEENAATYLRRASDYLDAIDKETIAAYENQTEADRQSIDLGQLPAGFAKSLRSTFEAYPKAIPLLEQASRCSTYDAQLDRRGGTSTFSDQLVRQTQHTRRAMRTLNHWAELQIAEGQTDAGLKTCLTMLRLCRLLDREPTLMGSLVALACRGLATATTDLALRSGPVTPELREALDKELEQHDVVAAYRRSLVEDRAFGLELLAESVAGKPRAVGDEKLAFVWRAAGFKDNQLAYLDYMAESIRLGGCTFAEAKDRPSVVAALQDAGPLAEMIAPITQAAQVAVCRGRVFLQCLRILNAMQRHEAAHPGMNFNLADLNLPADVLSDPFDGRSLRVVKQPGGWLIYSVGMDLQDDGGKVAEYRDNGFGPLPRTRTE